jgi:hypothetical protein
LNHFEKLNKKSVQKNKEIDEVYKNIKAYYTDMITEKGLISTRTERIRLENRIGKYEGVDEALFSSASVSIIVSVPVTIYLERLTQIGENIFRTKYPDAVFSFKLISFLSWIGLLIVLFTTIFNCMIKKSKLKNQICNISLRVLDEIDEENEDKNIDIIKKMEEALKTADNTLNKCYESISKTDSFLKAMESKNKLNIAVKELKSTNNKGNE